MLTRYAVEYLRAENAVISNAFPDPERFLNAIALFPTGRILFVPVRSDAEFADVVLSSTVACLARSGEVSQAGTVNYTMAESRFKADILKLCEIIPTPIIDNNRPYTITDIIPGANNPRWLLKPSDSGSGKVIAFDFARMKTFLMQNHLGLRINSQERASLLAAINERWQQFRSGYADQLLVDPELPPTSLAEISTLTAAVPHAGVLVMTPKAPFKKQYLGLPDREDTAPYISWAETVLGQQQQQHRLSGLPGGPEGLPLLVIHEHNNYTAEWLKELQSPAVITVERPALPHLKTLILDSSELSFQNAEQESAQITELKELIHRKEIHNVVCLVRIPQLAGLSATMDRWQTTGRSDIPVYAWQVSRQQGGAVAVAQSNITLSHTLVPVKDSHYEEKGRRFLSLIYRLRDILLQMPGIGQLHLLSSLRELYYRYISFYDPDSFRAYSDSYLERLQELENYIAGNLFLPLHSSLKQLLTEICAVSMQEQPLAATALKNLIALPASRYNLFRLSVLSYNSCPDDRQSLVRFLEAGIIRTTPLRVSFPDHRNELSAITAAEPPHSMLLCFNLPGAAAPWGFAASLFFHQYARHCAVLADETTTIRYRSIYQRIKGIYDLKLNDWCLTKVLELPEEQILPFHDGRSCFEYHLPELSARTPAPVPTADEQQDLAEQHHSTEGEFNIETLISRFLHQRQRSAGAAGAPIPDNLPGALIGLLLDSDELLRVPSTRLFYRVGEESEEFNESARVRAAQLRPGDSILIFIRSGHGSFNNLIDDSLAKTAPYSGDLKTAAIWREALTRINDNRRAEQTIVGLFAWAGFDRTQATFDNYLNGNTTKPQDLSDLLEAINRVSKTMQFAHLGIPSFTKNDSSTILAAVDRISSVRTNLPLIIRNRLLRGNHEQAETAFSPELISAVQEGVRIRRIREVNPI